MAGTLDSTALDMEMISNLSSRSNKAAAGPEDRSITYVKASYWKQKMNELRPTFTQVYRPVIY